MAENQNKELNLKIGSKANEVVACAQCSKQVSGSQAFTYKTDKGETLYLCEECRNTAEKDLKAETENPNLVMAGILGFVAAVVAGAIWYAVSILTGYQIGYLAIGVGFLIGWAIVFGSGKKRGSVLQLMSAAITLVTLFTSQYFILLYYFRKYMLENPGEFPGYKGEMFLVSPFNPEILQGMISPMGLVIWGIGIYFAFTIPKSRSV